MKFQFRNCLRRLRSTHLLNCMFLTLDKMISVKRNSLSSLTIWLFWILKSPVIFRTNSASFSDWNVLTNTTFNIFAILTIYKYLQYLVHMCYDFNIFFLLSVHGFENKWTVTGCWGAELWVKKGKVLWKSICEHPFPEKTSATGAKFRHICLFISSFYNQAGLGGFRKFVSFLCLLLTFRNIQPPSRVLSRA